MRRKTPLDELKSSIHFRRYNPTGNYGSEITSELVQDFHENLNHLETCGFSIIDNSVCEYYRDRFNIAVAENKYIEAIAITKGIRDFLNEYGV